MEKICGYFLTIIAAALLAAVAQGAVSQPRMRAITALCAGAAVLLSVLSPLLTLRLEQLPTAMEQLLPDGAAELERMQTEAENQVDAIIIENTRTYILDKAKSLGAMISVQLTLARTEDGFSTPDTVTITGTVTPGQKRELTQYMQDVLGILPEKQIWRTI